MAKMEGEDFGLFGVIPELSNAEKKALRAQIEGDREVRTIPPHSGYDTELLCGRCGFNFLHIGRVEEGRGIFEPGKLRRPVELGSPVDIAIEFWCENCGDGLELTIDESKGNTYLAWRWLRSSY